MIVLRLSLKPILFACLFFFSAGIANAQDVQKIVAIVNDEIISGYDLNQRIALTIVMSGFPDTQETRQQLRKPTLAKLIDDRLKSQEAKKNNLSISDEDVNRALTSFDKTFCFVKIVIFIR